VAEGAGFGLSGASRTEGADLTGASAPPAALTSALGTLGEIGTDTAGIAKAAIQDAKDRTARIADARGDTLGALAQYPGYLGDAAALATAPLTAATNRLVANPVASGLNAAGHYLNENLLGMKSSPDFLTPGDVNLALSAGAPGVVGQSGLLTRAGNALTRALTPAVTPGTAALAAKAKDMGIDLNMKQITPVSNPNFGGIDQPKQWTKQFSNTMGIDTNSVTAPVAKQALRMNGQTMENIANSNGITVDQPLLDTIQNMRQQVGMLADGSTESKWANKHLDTLEAAATDPSGVIDGPTYQRLTNFNSEIGKNIRRASSNTSDLAYDMKAALDDAFTRTATDPDAVQAWINARNQYRQSVLGKKLADKAGPDGTLNPQALKPMLKGNVSGTNADLADIGQLLPKPTFTGGIAVPPSSFGKGDALTIATAAAGPLYYGLPIHAGAAAAGAEAALLASRKLMNSRFLADMAVQSRLAPPANPLVRTPLPMGPGQLALPIAGAQNYLMGGQNDQQ